MPSCPTVCICHIIWIGQVHWQPEGNLLVVLQPFKNAVQPLEEASAEGYAVTPVGFIIMCLILLLVPIFHINIMFHNNIIVGILSQISQNQVQYLGSKMSL